MMLSITVTLDDGRVLGVDTQLREPFWREIIANWDNNPDKTNVERLEKFFENTKRDERHFREIAGTIPVVLVALAKQIKKGDDAK